MSYNIKVNLKNIYYTILSTFKTIFFLVPKYFFYLFKSLDTVLLNCSLFMEFKN